MGKDQNGHGYVLADISGRYPPTEWAPLARAGHYHHDYDEKKDTAARRESDDDHDQEQ